MIEFAFSMFLLNASYTLLMLGASLLVISVAYWKGR